MIVMMFTNAALLAKAHPVTVRSATFSMHADEKFVPKVYRKRLGDDWKVFCKDFASNFIVGKGPQGRGVFSKVECQPLTFGGNDAGPVLDENSWHFEFSWSGKGLSVAIYFQAEARSEGSLPFREFSLPPIMNTDLIFTSQDAKYHLISQTYRQLPMAWNYVFRKEDRQWQMRGLDEPMLAGMPALRKTGLFALTFNAKSGVWAPTLYAIADPITAEEGKRPLDRLGKTALNLRWIRTPHKSQIRLWAQEILDPLDAERDLSFLRRDSNHSILERYASENFKADTVSLRYGSPLPRGENVIGQAEKIEATVSIGKGMFEGLWLGAEYSPRRELEDDGKTNSYHWERLGAGWSLILGDTRTIDRFASRFRLTPRLGVLTLDTYLPGESSGDVGADTLTHFKLDRQLEIGQEFAWQIESLSYRGKLWVSTHLSGYLLAPKNATKVSNQRVGADFSFDMYKSRNGLRIGLLAFGYIDWMSLQTRTLIDPNSNLAGVDNTSIGATYSYSYVGLGLSLGW